MATPVIVAATRTAIGTLGGALAQTPATKLGAIAVREAVRRAKLDPAQVDEVILGHVLPAGLGLNPGRVAALEAGIPKEVPSYTVNKACGSGLKAVALAAQAIQLDQADAIVAGGMESMSGAPYILKKVRFGVRMGNDELIDSMIADGLTCPITLVHMGITAENVAAKYGIPREEQDEFAAESQQKTAAAQRAGKFKAEIVPVQIPGRKGPTTVDTDESPRKDTSLEALAKLKPAFPPKSGSTENLTVTAGNAPGLNDGASALVVTSEEYARAHGLTILARITGYATGATAPQDLFFAPVTAVRNLMAKAGTSISDYDLIEANEAFASQALADGDQLGWAWDRVNVNGGAIALGHPIGASGARVLTTLLYALEDRNKERGLATLCLGGGDAVALSVERVN